MTTYRARVRWLRMGFLLVLFLSGCGALRSDPPRPDVELGKLFPTEMPPAGPAQLFDVNGDGQNEWLIFYHIDLVEQVEDSPTIAAVYRPVRQPDDERLPPYIVPMLLWLPRQGYLCLHSCEASMEQVISDPSNREELVIRDKRGDEVVGVALFRWKGNDAEGGSAASGGLMPVGHFRGDSITVNRDEITVLHDSEERSDLAVQEKYRPQNGHYYIQEPQNVDDPQGAPIAPYEAEVVFGSGPPEDPASVNLPEKLVLALYHDFTDLDKISQYFVPATWERFGGSCPAGMCGCQSPHQDISRVMVKLLAYQAELEPNFKTVVRVVCVRGDDQVDPPGTATWTLIRQEDETWRLSDVRAGGEELLPSLTPIQP